MSATDRVDRIVIDLGAWDAVAPWMNRRAWGLSFLERLHRLLAKRPELERIGLTEEGQKVEPQLLRACDRVRQRSDGQPRIAAPRLHDGTLYLPVNIVCTRAWIQHALAGQVDADGYALIDSDASFSQGKALVLSESYKRSTEGLSKLHRWLSWYFGQPFFHLRVPPNVTTVLSVVVNLLGGWAILKGWFVTGAVIFQVSCMLDSVDGVTARLHVHESKFGVMLDHYLDYVYYVILVVTTAFGAYAQTKSVMPLVVAGLGVIGALAATGSLEWFRRVYRFESNQAFNKQINVLIAQRASFKRYAGALHVFKRHTLPYVYLVCMMLGAQNLVLVSFNFGFLVPFIAGHMFRSLEKEGHLSRER